MLLLTLILACHETPQVAVPERTAPAPTAALLRFSPALAVEGPDGAVLATAIWGGVAQTMRWQVLIREGETHGGLPFGTILNRDGAPIERGGRTTCRGPDFNGLFDAFGQTWLLTHQECTPGAIYLTKLASQAGETLTALSSAPVDLSGTEGLNNLCAGAMTTWGSLLSGEEYETNAALIVNDALVDPVPGLLPGRRYYDNSDYKLFRLFASSGTPASPYHNGWMVETRLLDEAGDTAVLKHRAMGRFSHELGALMPDGRTVYMSDDGSYGMFAMFVADKAEDLSAGTLYAARWSGGETPTLSWVNLGHATNAEIEAALAGGVTFSDLFERSLPTDGACPAGSHFQRGPMALDECITLREGKEKLASRLESRRYAGLMGASLEINKSEGLALDAEGRSLFLATTRVGDGMLAGDPPGADDVAVAKNPCGVVWRFNLTPGALDTAGAPIDSPWVASTGEAAVRGVPEGEGCAESSVSEPDNLAFIAGQGVLLIAEDTDRLPNRLWAWQDGALFPIFAAPKTDNGGAEVSGLSWVRSAGGASWITMSLQHPGDTPAMVGVLGPFHAP